MCGILGQIAIKGNLKFNKSKFIKCLSYLNHRGPDDEGYQVYPGAILGHKRLSILDLSKNGHQPMVSSDGNYVIIFNGEIYNFDELKRDLIRKKYTFSSKSDTEVLLYGLIDQGPSFVKKCNGMFAFAFYDVKKKTTYIFRDRIGIKPLFYSIYNNKITFSSNVKSIHKLNDMKKKIDLESVSAFLAFRQPIENKTFFENIQSLEPGCYIEIKNNNLKIKKYWKLEKFFLRKYRNKKKNFFKKKIKTLLNSSVNYRLISDVKVASLLSGGLDSSIISAIVNDSHKENFLSYSIGYKYSGYNEFKYSKLVAKKLNMQHRIIVSSPMNYFKDMKKLISVKGQPLTIPNEVAQYQLCKKIKKKATVILSGSGADELFCGYGRIFSSVEDYKKLEIISTNNKHEKYDIFLKNIFKRYKKIKFKNYLDHFLTIYPYMDMELRKKILSKKFNHIKINKNINGYFKKIFKMIKNKNYYDKMQFCFQKFHLRGILEREDLSSMAASTELRVPFLDHRIIEFAAKIPNKLKIRELKNNFNLTSDKTSEINDITKYILRKTYEKKIPKQILNRKKIGFPIPLHKWLKKKNIQKIIFSTLLSSKSKKRGLFNLNFIKELLKDNSYSNFDGDSRVYQTSIAAKLWMCFNLECFFLDQDESK
jgi:asparagine synthase (glutamine-hydrolysing)